MFLTFRLNFLSRLDAVEVIDGDVTTVGGEGCGEEFADTAAESKLTC
jgi:hypothetical protein